MHRMQTLEERAREQDRHIGHRRLRSKYGRTVVPTKSYGRGRERFSRRIWSDRRAMKFEARAEMQLLWDGTMNLGGFDEVTEPMQASSRQGDNAVGVERQFKGSRVSELLSKNPRLIIAHSKDVHLTLVNVFDELLANEETVVFDPEEVAEMGFHYMTV